MNSCRFPVDRRLDEAWSRARRLGKRQFPETLCRRTSIVGTIPTEIIVTPDCLALPGYIHVGLHDPSLSDLEVKNNDLVIMTLSSVVCIYSWFSVPVSHKQRFSVVVFT